MASYHKWAYQRLIDSIHKLSDEHYRKDCKLFFGSIHGTLNHLYLVDCLWYGRFVNIPSGLAALDIELIQDRKELAEAIIQQAEKWIEFTKTIPETAPETLSYKNTKGIENFMPYVPTLAHIFNHGTHHRGQISAAITQAGLEPPEMDLFYYLKEIANK